MGHYTSTYFQWARGQAMVRNRSMRRARSCKARGDHEAVRWLVARAREANREWRKYRRWDMEYRQLS